MKSIIEKLEIARLKLAKNEERLAWREKNGFTKTFTTQGNPEKKPLSPCLQLIHNVGDYCAHRIESSINRSKAEGTNKTNHSKTAKNSREFYKKELKSATDKARKSAKGEFFQFSNCDKEEIYGVTAEVLSAIGFFDHSSPFTHAEIERTVLDVIINQIKSIDGLELNRFKHGKHASIDAMTNADSDDTNPANCGAILPELKKTLRQSAIEKIAESNEDHDSLQSKIDAIHSMIDCFHDASDSRKKEALRKTDKQFFQKLLTCTATGDGETTREAFLMQAKRFLERVIAGYELLIQNSDNGTKFNSFDHLAVLFKAMK